MTIATTLRTMLPVLAALCIAASAQAAAPTATPGAGAGLDLDDFEIQGEVLAPKAMFIVGGLSGIFMAAVPVDIYFHDTYFIVAHFHYVLFGATLFGVFAAIHFWYPKMFGTMLNETLGKIHFWFTIIPFNLIFLPLFVLGAAGQHRRIYNYDHFPELATDELQALRVLATVSLYVMLLAQPVFIYNFFASLKNGKPAGKNPWKANSLEWVAPSPPGHGNFDPMPTVYRGPYEYSHPDRLAATGEDYWPQNIPGEEGRA